MGSGRNQDVVMSGRPGVRAGLPGFPRPFSEYLQPGAAVPNVDGHKASGMWRLVDPKTGDSPSRWNSSSITDFATATASSV